MEELIGLLLELVGEVLFQFVIELASEYGFQLTRAAIRPTSGRTYSVVRASAGQLLIGAAAGLITALLLPERLLPPVAMPGISLVLSPIGTGALMGLFGRWTRQRGNTPSSLATFRGGALFAFACAATRYLMVMGWPSWIGSVM